MKKYPIKEVILLCVIGASSSAVALEKPAKRPNFVWFMEEDVSKHYFRLYNPEGLGAATPNVKKLAKEGILFSHAFCNAPVS